MVPKNITYANAFKEILDFFHGDKDKAIAWYMSPNVLLGNTSPFEMIKNGRGQKLMKFIRSCMDENRI
jgi:uncharacterized protein (DUF2384 family)